MMKEVKKAAVLIPFTLKEGKLSIILTVREKNLNQHSGQICFPGGKQEPGETPLKTALREIEEEIGIKGEDIEVIGEIEEEMVYKTGYLVKPFVGLIKGKPDFKVNEKEVKEVIVIPLEDLKKIPVKIESFKLGDKEISYPVYNWQGYRIWGATARIVSKLLERKDVLDELNRRAHVYFGRDMEGHRTGR